MKHMRKLLVSFFSTLVPLMEDKDSNHSETATIRDLCSAFKKTHPNEECPSDMQIRMAADDVFKHGGYEGVAKVWITEKLWLREQVARLTEENKKLQQKLWDKSHAGRVLRAG